MKIAIAVLTYRRCETLSTMLKGLAAHCPIYPTAVFEDCGQRDATADMLQLGRTPEYREDLMAYEYVPDDRPSNFTNMRVFMGERNLGVSGNSNRALRWFMEETDADVLCLCNDDLLVYGDFAKLYATAHRDLGVGMFCFCDFDKASPAISGAPETYKWTTYRVRGYGVKFLPRLTGIMMSVTRKIVAEIGYFDMAFGQFGEEHCDYTYRCRFAGGIRLDGQDMNALDIEHTLLGHQECETSVTGEARTRANKEASVAMQQAAADYRWRHYFRPYRLALPKFAGGYHGGGIPVNHLLESGYKLVTALAR